MVRFILITFVFMGWLFYELSGGSEFVPRSAQITARDTAAQEVQAEKTAPEATAAPAPEVSRVSLNLSALEDVLDGDTLIRNPPIETVALNTQEPSSAPTQSNLPQITPDPAPVTDLRSVTGNSVNVRGGPGTEYGVVARMVRGDQVEVLEDNGNGWIRMRQVDGAASGWIADFLLSDG